jgi:hypothetical protein
MLRERVNDEDNFMLNIENFIVNENINFLLWDEKTL